MKVNESAKTVQPSKFDKAEVVVSEKKAAPGPPPALSGGKAPVKKQITTKATTAKLQ